MNHHDPNLSPALVEALNAVERLTADLAPADLALALDALEAVRSRLFRRCVLATNGNHPQNGNGRAERILSLTDAAIKLNRKEDWLRRNGRRLGVLVQLDGPGSAVGYSEKACDRLIARSTLPP